jgi:hypothetical protein
MRVTPLTESGRFSRTTLNSAPPFGRRSLFHPDLTDTDLNNENLFGKAG